MPKIEWKNRPDVLKKYCTCPYIHASYVSDTKDRITMEADGGLWVLIKFDENCKLHGDNPDHELQEWMF